MIRYKNRNFANPVAAGFAGIIVYILILFLSPTTITLNVEGIALGFVILSYLMFFFGATFAMKAKVATVRPLFLASGRRRQRFHLATAAIISIITTVYDRFVARGASFSGDFLESREAIASIGSTPAGILGALLLPAVYLYLFETYRARNAGEKVFRLQVPFSILLVFAHPAIGLIFGSRSTLLSSMFFLFAFSIYFRRTKINWWVTCKLIIAGFVFALLLGYLFLQRLEVMNMLAVYSVKYSVYASMIQPNNAAMGWLEDDQGSFMFLLIFSFVNLAQYYTHGLLELLYQVSHETEITHSYGAYLLYIPYKMIGMFVALPDVFQKIAAAKMTLGAYTSFFGPVHSDFGWFSLLFMLLFGYYSGRIYKISVVTLDYVPLSILLLATAFFFPVVNFLLLGPNFYAFVGFTAFAIWNRRIYGKY
mgnify:CR=1 FL=1